MYEQFEMNYKRILKTIKAYLDNPPKIDGADYLKQLDEKYICDTYNLVVNIYDGLLKLFNEVYYFISVCKETLKKLDNTPTSLRLKEVLKSYIDTMEIYLVPLNNEKDRIKTFEMMYRNFYSRKDF